MIAHYSQNPIYLVPGVKGLSTSNGAHFPGLKKKRDISFIHAPQLQDFRSYLFDGLRREDGRNKKQALQSCLLVFAKACL